MKKKSLKDIILPSTTLTFSECTCSNAVVRSYLFFTVLDVIAAG